MTDVELFDAFAGYQAGRAFSPNTIKRRTLALRRFARHMAPASVTTATMDDVEEWLGEAEHTEDASQLPLRPHCVLPLGGASRVGREQPGG